MMFKNKEITNESAPICAYCKKTIRKDRIYGSRGDLFCSMDHREKYGIDKLYQQRSRLKSEVKEIAQDIDRIIEYIKRYDCAEDCNSVKTAVESFRSAKSGIAEAMHYLDMMIYE